MERAMKVQDVMLQAMAKKITWVWQAAEILGKASATGTCGGGGSATSKRATTDC